MAVVYITEYAAQGVDSRNAGIPTGQEPAIAVQTVAIGVSSVQSALFNAQTTFVRVHTDAVCSIRFGTNPTATATSPRMAAGSTEFFGLDPSQRGALRLAVITNT